MLDLSKASTYVARRSEPKFAPWSWAALCWGAVPVALTDWLLMYQLYWIGVQTGRLLSHGTIQSKIRRHVGSDEIRWVVISEAAVCIREEMLEVCIGIHEDLFFRNKNGISLLPSKILRKWRYPPGGWRLGLCTCRTSRNKYEFLLINTITAGSSALGSSWFRQSRPSLMYRNYV